MTGEVSIMYHYRFAGYGIRNALGEIVGYCTDKGKAKAFCQEKNIPEVYIFMLYDCVKL